MALTILKQFISSEQSRMATTGSLSLEEEVLLEYEVKRLESLPLSKHGAAMHYVEMIVDIMLARKKEDAHETHQAGVHGTR